MKKLESSLTNMVLVLTGVAVVMGGILAWVNHVTSGPISEQKQMALEQGIKTVMQSDNLRVDNTDTIPAADGKSVYIIYNNEKGAAVQSSVMGFGGELKVLVGFDHDGSILGYTLLEHQETPGLGAKADQWFQKGQKGDIIGKNPAEGLTVSKDGGQVDAITASTITSRAFLRAVTNAYNAYKGNGQADASTGATEQAQPECCQPADSAQCCQPADTAHCCQPADTAQCCQPAE